MNGWMRVVAANCFFGCLVVAVVCPYFCWFRIDDCFDVKSSTNQGIS